MDDRSVALPSSASDDDDQESTVNLADAYLKNPIAEKSMLTPIEAIDAISLLSAMLLGDERYRLMLANRKAPCGN